MTLRWTPPALPRSRFVAEYRNTAEHASIVHNGARARSGADYPAREFMSGAFGEKNDFDAESYFAGQFRRTESIAKSYQATVAQGQREIKLLIRSDIWAWPRETERKRGAVGSPRNIVDTGELLRSQKPVRFR